MIQTPWANALLYAGILFVVRAAGLFIKKPTDKKKYICSSLMLVAVAAAAGVAYARRGENSFVPLQMVSGISEYGYKAIWSALLSRMLPFMAAGALLPFVDARADRLWKVTIMGLGAAAIIEVPKLFIPALPFEMDSVLLGGIGAAAGCSLMLVLRGLFTKKGVGWGLAWKESYFWRGFICIVAVVAGLSAILLIDNGSEFVPLALYTPDTPLPENTAVTATLPDTERAMTYLPLKPELDGEAQRLAQALGMRYSPQAGEGFIIVRDGSRTLNVSGEGSFEYEDSVVQMGGAMVEESEVSGRALQTLAALYPGGGFSQPRLERVTEEDEDGEEVVVGYRAYCEQYVDGALVVGSGGLVMGIGDSSLLAYINRFGTGYEPYREVKIIGAQEALNRIMNGEGAHSLFAEAFSVTITKCELAYYLETVNGVLQPIWRFTGESVGEGGAEPFEAFIAAMEY